MRRSIGSYRRHTAFPSEGLAAPGSAFAVGWSGQWSFWQQHYPGVMITDTAPFRYPFYHSADDTAAPFEALHSARPGSSSFP